MAETEDRGRCVSCGFLAKRAAHTSQPAPHVILPAYYEIDEYWRRTGDVWTQVQDSLSGRIITEPFCFRQAAQIKQEVDSISKEFSNASLAAQEVFKRDRNCSSWYPYNPGLSPKDHFDQMTMELLEQSRRDFELRLFKITEQIQKDSRKVATRSFWFNLFFTLVLIFLTCVQIWLALGENRLILARLLEQLFKVLILKFS